MSAADVLQGMGVESLFALLAAAAAGWFGLVRWFVARLERGLDARFDAMERARMESHHAWHESFTDHIRREEREFEALRDLDRSFLEFRAALPTLYIRRDELRDYLVRLDIRFDTMNDKLNRLLTGSEAPTEESPHEPT